MSLTNGLEYINTTKQNIKTRLQGKGVNVSDSSPFRQYPDLIESELKNKSWQYPSDWYALTPKAEFPDHTIEMVAFDADYPFCFYITGAGTLTITVLGGADGGTYKLNNTVYNLNQTYTTSTGKKTLQFTKGTGVPCNSTGFTTLKIILTFATRLVSFYPTHIDTSRITYNPILALRARDSTSYNKTIYFGTSHRSGSTILYYRGVHQYMQYCDLSMVKNLVAREYQFYDCFQMVKCEVPDGFVPANYGFQQANCMQELIGVDFSNVYNRVYVFSTCQKFTPPALNYRGEYCYSNCNFKGKTLVLTDMTEYPSRFLSSSAYNTNDTNDSVGDFYKVVIPDTCTSFTLDAIRNLSESRAIIRLPSCQATITTDPEYTGINTGDSFIYQPYKIENGENFYLDTPVGVKVSGAYYGEEEVYLPHVPLRFFEANSSSPSGNLKKITFDWENTDFGDCIAATSSGYVIDIRGNKFDHDTLVELFNNLPTLVDVTRNIRITNNPGVSSLTDEEIAIVTDKGYVLTK